MIGRLSTERDKARLLEGLTSAAGGVDVGLVGDTISGLGKREFVLRVPGKDATSVFTTRWAMSYLRGPMTRDQISELMVGERDAATAAAIGGALCLVLIPLAPAGIPIIASLTGAFVALRIPEATE